MILTGKILTRAIHTFVFVLCCIGSELAYSSNSDYLKFESWCEEYINMYEMVRRPDVFFPAFMEVPRELNDYLIESAKNGDFRLLKYAATVALIVDAEISQKCTISSCLAGTGAEGNGFVALLLKASGKFKNFDDFQDENQDGYFIIRVSELGSIVRENSINLSEEDYNYAQEKFIAYLKRKNYGVVDECSRVLHISDSIVYKITSYDKIRKIEFETLDYINGNYCVEEDLAKCANLESVTIKHPKGSFFTKDGVLYYEDILLFYPPQKKDRVIKLPNNVFRFKAKNNSYLEEIQFTNIETDFFSVDVSNCKNVRRISTPKKLLYMKTDSLDYFGGADILVNGKKLKFE